MKRTFKKTLNVLLMLTVLCSVIFAMSLTANAESDYITINGIQIKDGQYLRENDSTTTTTMPGSGSDYAYYKSGLLTLNNFDITGNNDFAVILADTDKLTINLVGTNSINTSYGYAFRTNYKTILTFMGSGSLTIDCSANYAIHCSNLAIAGGTLTVNAAGYALICYDYTQTAGTVTLTSSKDYQALWVQGPADITGGTLTVEASNCGIAAVVDEDLYVSGGTVNIKAKTDMAGVAVGGTYTQTGGTVNLATKGYAGLATTGTGKVTLTGGELKATGTGIGLQTAKADVEIGRCDVIMEGVYTGIDCAGTVTFNGNGITKITASQNGISCKDFNITKTGEFLVSGQSGLAVASSDKSWTVDSEYTTSVSTNYQGKDAVPLSNQSVTTAKYFFTRETVIHIAGVPIGYDEYLPKNGKAASTYKPSDNYIHTQANGERLELIVKNCDIAATGSTEAIKAATSLLITGTGTLNITSQSGSAILLSNGHVTMSHSGTVNIKSNTMNGIVLQTGSYVQTDGTVNIEAGNGILAAQGDVTISKGALNVKSTGIGITTKNVVVNGTKLDVTGSNRALLLLTGSLTAKRGVSIKAATTATGTLGTYDSANIASYKRVFVGNYVCSAHKYTNDSDTTCNNCGAYAYPGGNTLVKENDIWYHIKDRQKVNDTTLVKYGGYWFYVKDGVVDFNATTLCYYGGYWFYVKNGQVDWTSNTLCKWNGMWFHVKDGKVVYDTTLVNYGGYWFYVKNGQVDFNATTLCYFGSNWYYVKGGQVNYSNTLCNWNGKWWHVKDGKVVYDTTLVYFASKWYYVKSGELNYSNTLCNWNGRWWHVKDGNVAYDTTLVYFAGSWYYVKSGELNYSNTLCNWNGKWWHVKDGTVVYDTTLVYFGSNWYYVKSGVVDFNYSGEVLFAGNYYTVKNGVKV